MLNICMSVYFHDSIGCSRYRPEEKIMNYEVTEGVTMLLEPCVLVLGKDVPTKHSLKRQAKHMLKNERKSRLDFRLLFIINKCRTGETVRLV